MPRGGAVHACASAACAAILALAPATARATCEADAVLATGVTVRRCTEDGRRWSVVRADLAASDVGVRVARSAERGQTASAWMASVPGAIAVVQGGPFRFPGWDPEGLTIGEGEPWPASADDGRLAVLALDESGAGLFVPAPSAVTTQAWMRSAISGVEVLRAGTPVRDCVGAGCERAPRTAMGLSEDGRTLVIVVVEGWTAASEGVSDPELGAMALEAGAHDALRAGEGATSALTTTGGAGEIAPSEGALRPAGPFFAIVDRGSGATGDLVGVVERRSDTMPLPAATLRVETTDGRLVAMGGTLTTNAFFRFSVPERTYIVRASLAGYREDCRVCFVPRGRDTWCSLFLEPGSGAAECSAPPRGVDAGVFPLADAGAPALDAGRADAGSMRPIDGGCVVAPGSSSRALAPWALAGLVAVAATVRRRSRGRA